MATIDDSTVMYLKFKKIWPKLDQSIQNNIKNDFIQKGYHNFQSEIIGDFSGKLRGDSNFKSLIKTIVDTLWDIYR